MFSALSSCVVTLCCSVMLMFDKKKSFFLNAKKRNTMLKNDLPMCLLPALECLNSEWQNGWNFLFIVVGRKNKNIGFCRMSGIATNNTCHFFLVRSQTAIKSFGNIYEDILNLSKLVGNIFCYLIAIQGRLCVAIPDIRHYVLLLFQRSFSPKVINSLSSTLKWWLPIQYIVIYTLL